MGPREGKREKNSSSSQYVQYTNPAFITEEKNNKYDKIKK